MCLFNILNAYILTNIIHKHTHYRYGDKRGPSAYRDCVQKSTCGVRDDFGGVLATLESERARERERARAREREREYCVIAHNMRVEHYC